MTDLFDDISSCSSSVMSTSCSPPPSLCCHKCRMAFTFNQPQKADEGFQPRAAMRKAAAERPPPRDPRLLDCGHNICRDCLVQGFQSHSVVCCPRSDCGLESDISYLTNPSKLHPDDKDKDQEALLLDQFPLNRLAAGDMKVKELNWPESRPPLRKPFGFASVFQPGDQAWQSQAKAAPLCLSHSLPLNLYCRLSKTRVCWKCTYRGEHHYHSKSECGLETSDEDLKEEPPAAPDEIDMVKRNLRHTAGKLVTFKKALRQQEDEEARWLKEKYAVTIGKLLMSEHRAMRQARLIMVDKMGKMTEFQSSVDLSLKSIDAAKENSDPGFMSQCLHLPCKLAPLKIQTVYKREEQPLVSFPFSVTQSLAFTDYKLLAEHFNAFETKIDPLNAIVEEGDFYEEENADEKACQPPGSVLRYETLPVHFTNHVEVSFLSAKSPGDFYLQTKEGSPRHRMHSLDLRIEEIEHTLRELPEKQQKFGKICLVKQEGARRRWARAEIVEMLDNVTACVNLIDLAEEVETSLENLYVIPSEILGVPVQALRCKLANAVPIAPTREWYTETCIYFRKLLERENRRLLVCVTECDEGVHSVELFIKKPRDVHGEPPTSIKHILQYRQEIRFARANPRTNETAQYFPIPEEVFEQGSEHKGNITRVKDDGTLNLIMYGEGGQYMSKLKSTQRHMRELYESESGLEYTLECPRLEQPCAARLKKENRYERAKIIDNELEDKEKVKVLLVDTGEEAVWPLEDLRLIPSRYMSLHKLSLPVRLYDVENIRDGAAVFKILKDKELLVFVEDCCCKGPTEVTLYEQFDMKDVCLNALIVREGLGASANKGADIRRVDYFKKDPDLLLEQGQGHLLCDYSIEVDGSFQPCRVIKVRGPDKIFLTMTPKLEGYKELEQAMFDAYFNNKEGVKENEEDWSLGDNCAVESDGRFKRSKIIKRPTEKGQQFQVYFTDEGSRSPAFLHEMRSLQPEFDKMMPLGVICVLHGVKPSEGEAWTSEAVKATKEFLDGSGNDDVLVKMNSTIEDDHGMLRFEVTLAKRFERPRDALEPSGYTTHDLASHLVQLGLAVETGTGRVEKVAVPKYKRLKWLPPELPLDGQDIKGRAVYVDHEACVFVVRSEVEETIAEMREKADELCELSLTRPHDRYWYVGEPCFTRFAWDQHWYRGEVAEVKGDGTFAVVLIDYGTMQMVKAEDMRKDIMFTVVPNLSTRVRLEGIKPKGNRWKTEVILSMHRAIVDKDVKVRLSHPPTSWPILATIEKMEGGDYKEILLFHGLTAKEEEAEEG